MPNHAFICQISEEDWLLSREIGFYGNREGSERRGGIRYFDSGSPTVQSIIEDLIGMRKGDLVFFHVIKTAEGESSIHGVYQVRDEPFYNDVRIWKSSSHFVFPYRFCFEPHPEHTELCKYDVNILVSEFYAAIENGDIRSISTLEREVRGAAHAVKTISREDAEQIVKLLYRSFHNRRLQRPVNFKPRQFKNVSPLRDHIKRIGEVEFAVKALVAYKLGREDPALIRLIPACRNTEYDFLIQTFIGQTIRKPVDFLIIGYKDSSKKVTTIEAKKDRAEIEHLVQLLRYQEAFKIRNADKGALAYEYSSCLLAKRFEQELIQYVSTRNLYVPWEKIILLEYTPSHNGRDATFNTLTLRRPTVLPSKTFPKTKVDVADSRSDPEGFYSELGKDIPTKINLEFLSSEGNFILLRKYYSPNKVKAILSHVLIDVVDGKCTDKEFVEFMDRLHREVLKFQGNFMAVEPILIAEDYDNLVAFFIDKYNTYETRAGKQPISAYSQ